MDDMLRELAESPITTAARANKVFLPMGRKPAKREEKRTASPAELKAARDHREKQATAKVSQLLDYYATTTLPVERIADHMKMPTAQIRESMKLRGRVK